MEYSNWFVCLMGMGTVFFGLICLILLMDLMGKILSHGKTQEAPAAAPAPIVDNGPLQPQVVAAISAAIAEDLGTDITGIRITSIKKV